MRRQKRSELAAWRIGAGVVVACAALAGGGARARGSHERPKRCEDFPRPEAIIA
jgi:hypothetical protein